MDFNKIWHGVGHHRSPQGCQISRCYGYIWENSKIAKIVNFSLFDDTVMERTARVVIHCLLGQHSRCPNNVGEFAHAAGDALPRR